MDIPAPLLEVSSPKAVPVCPESPVNPKLVRTTGSTNPGAQVRSHLVIFQKLNSKGIVFVTPMTGNPPGSTVLEDTKSYLSGIADPMASPVPKSEAISHFRFVPHDTLEEAKIAAARGGDKDPQAQPWFFGKPESRASSDSARSVASSNPSIETPPLTGAGDPTEADEPEITLADEFFKITKGPSVG
jgi:hypothetical protein